MKRLVLAELLLVCFCLMFLGACSGNDGSEERAQSQEDIVTSTDSETSEEPEITMGDFPNASYYIKDFSLSMDYCVYFYAFADNDFLKELFDAGYWPCEIAAVRYGTISATGIYLTEYSEADNTLTGTLEIFSPELKAPIQEVYDFTLPREEDTFLLQIDTRIEIDIPNGISLDSVMSDVYSMCSGFDPEMTDANQEVFEQVPQYVPGGHYWSIWTQGDGEQVENEGIFFLYKEEMCE